MSDHLKPYREAHERTSEVLSRLTGLSRALYQLAMEHTDLNTNDPINEALISLMTVIEEQAQQVGTLHSVEWDLVVK
jgi:hypothetical protein